MALQPDADIPASHQGDHVLIILETQHPKFGKHIAVVGGKTNTIANDENVIQWVQECTGARASVLMKFNGLSEKSARNIHDNIPTIQKTLGLTRHACLQFLMAERQ